MKFNCGPTPEERADERRRQQAEERIKLEQWHDYFTWWPIRIGSGDCRWLETIERKGEYHTPLDNFDSDYWHYFTPFWTWEFRSKR